MQDVSQLTVEKSIVPTKREHHKVKAVDHATPSSEEAKTCHDLAKMYFHVNSLFPRIQPVLNLVGMGESVILSIHVFAVHINQMTFTPNGRRSYLMILMAAIKVISFQTVALIWILSVIYADKISKEQLINVHRKHRMDKKSYCAIKSLNSLSVF